jgi:hypothetical protein
MRQTTNDPAQLAPVQRRREIAAILARGVLRLRRIAQTGPVSPLSPPMDKSVKFARDGLDVPAQSSPHATIRSSDEITVSSHLLGLGRMV